MAGDPIHRIKAPTRRAKIAVLGLMIGVSGCHGNADSCVAKTGDGICVDNGQAPANAN